MQTYEIRLLAQDGGVVLVHVTTCATDDDAREKVRKLGDPSFARYEIWQGTRKVDEGDNFGG